MKRPIANRAKQSLEQLYEQHDLYYSENRRAKINYRKKEKLDTNDSEKLDQNVNQKYESYLLKSYDDSSSQYTMGQSSQLDTSLQSIQNSVKTKIVKKPVFETNYSGGFVSQLKNQPFDNIQVPMTSLQDRCKITDLRENQKANKNQVVLYDEDGLNSVQQYDIRQCVKSKETGRKFVMFEQRDSMHNTFSALDSVLEVNGQRRTKKTVGLPPRQKNIEVGFLQANSSVPLTERNDFSTPLQRNENSYDGYLKEENEELGISTTGPKSHRSRKSYLTKQSTDQMKIDLNNFCIECQEKDPQWCSINNGIFICISCAGFHRGFGVQLSFVRSLEMDQMDPIQIKMLQIGGNRNFLELIQLYQIKDEDSDRYSKYYTKACAMYRDKLLQCAELDIEFNVDESWLDELPQSEGLNTVHQIDQANIRKIQRKYQYKADSSIDQVKNISQFLGECILKNRSSQKQSLLEKCGKFCCISNSYNQNQAQTDLSQMITPQDDFYDN